MQQPDIQLRMDFTKFEVVDTAALAEVPAPVAGITRRMIERDGGEVARATSIVRYEAGHQFPRHSHGLGEEIFVLSGTFADEHGSYPAGTYLRNPAAEPSSKIVLPVGITAAQAERELILKTLERTGQNKAEAARQLGLDVKTIRNKLKTYEIEDD